MPSDFERQQRLQLLVFGLVIYGVPVLIAVGLLTAGYFILHGMGVL